MNAFCPQGANPFEKTGALSDHQRLIRRRGVTPLMYQYGETVINPTSEMVRSSRRQPLSSFLKPSVNGTSKVRAVWVS